jgi:hypothetical protein
MLAVYTTIICQHDLRKFPGRHKQRQIFRRVNTGLM